MALTRLQMEDIVNSGGTIIWRGNRITDVADLPTQDELDYYQLTVPADNSAIVDAVDALSERFPLALDADGGMKVHLMNPEDIEGGGGGGTVGLTDAELRATPVPVSGTVAVSNHPASVSVSNFPAAQPVTDNGGSLTVDGTVAVSNFPATQPVSIASAVPVTDNAGSLTVDSPQLPTALTGDGNLKVDIVANTAAVGGASTPSPVTLYSNQAVTPNSEVMSAEISSVGYRGVRIRLQRMNAASGSMALRLYAKQPDGTFESNPRYQPTAIATSSTGLIELVVHPEVAVHNMASLLATASNFVPRAFKIAIFAGSAVSNTVYLDYQLLP